MLSPWLDGTWAAQHLLVVVVAAVGQTCLVVVVVEEEEAAMHGEVALQSGARA